MTASDAALVLVADDHDVHRYATARVLERAGYRVLQAASGGEALALDREATPDLVVLDVRLPDMSGYEVCLRIKSDPATTQVLVLHVSASFVRTDNAVRGLEGGADGYLTEPLEPPVLVATVKALLRARRAEEALRESETRHRMLFERHPLPSWVFDTATLRILSANDAAVESYGYTREEFLAMRVADLHSADEAPDFGRLGDGDASGRPQVWRHVKKDGTRVEVEISGAPLAFVRHTARLVMAADVSARQRVEQHRADLLRREQAARAQAEAVNRAKDEFLATLSHELRTPLNAIFGWTQLLRSAAVNEQTLRRGLDVLERNARLQAQLINDLLDVSSIIAGKLILDAHPVDVIDLAQATADSLRETAVARGIDLTVTTTPAPIVVEGDGPRLQQVLTNLIANAVKFTPPGGRVRVAVERDEAAVRLVVSDTGRGIGADFLPHIFDRFRQEDSSITRDYTGLGLGLAIVRHLVEMHGGRVVAASEGEGRGATFTVTLPLSGTALRLPPPPPPPARGASLAGLHVLVVDDDADALLLATVILEMAGARVTGARKGAEALAGAERTPPDVLVSDLGMPDLDGFELLRRMTARIGRRLPAVALTAYATEADAERSTAAGYQVHLSKPFDAAALTEAVARLAGRA
ncbi:MAG: response regulator [Candidatus Rokuibacteriota bacterium]